MDQQFPLTEEEKRLLTLKNQQLIEAALYLAGRPVPLPDLAQVSGLDTAEIGTLIKELQDKYHQFFSCFEIIELPGKKFVFQVKAEIAENVKAITLQPILTIAELRTLAMIAYQQPVMQSTVVKVRGQQSYSHVKNLIRNGFVKSIRVKQTLELRTTPMFSDYFGLSQDAGVLKRQLGWRTKRIIKEKKLEQRDSQSIEKFMQKLGLDNLGDESMEDIESHVSMDQDSARDLFPSMLDEMDEQDQFEEEEYESTEESDNEE
ncbi:MAG TPA: SMC-Scp complex subunit ScpB [candidate division Zixibacteria bacterium]|nr:SMC-Scp complex subunit ScpB [candidate division Zixibacteria bacterium]